MMHYNYGFGFWHLLVVLFFAFIVIWPITRIVKRTGNSTGNGQRGIAGRPGRLMEGRVYALRGVAGLNRGRRGPARPRR